jgi:hypothetical protein
MLLARRSALALVSLSFFASRPARAQQLGDLTLRLRRPSALGGASEA